MKWLVGSWDYTLHPDVLTAIDLNMPTLALEIDTEPLLMSELSNLYIANLIHLVVANNYTHDGLQIFLIKKMLKAGLMHVCTNTALVFLIILVHLEFP